MPTSKRKEVKTDKHIKAIAKIDELFRRMEQDASLPTFGEHFMTCLILGNAESVNLRKMYPALYKKLTSWLANHNKKITG